MLAGIAPLRAPFPWFGGKRRAASLVWDRFGDVPNYIEPFAGSLAVLLGRPTPPRIETVNDKDAYLCNFWRAIQADPEKVAHYADWPVNEADLHARHRWLTDTGATRVATLMTDPLAYDVQVAGWWVWGLSLWIGDGWCSRPEWRGRANAARDARGIHKRPAVASGNGHGGGVNALYVREPRETLWQARPSLSSAGEGVHRKRTRSDRGSFLNGSLPAGGIYEYFTRLAERLRRVRVCVGDWTRVVGPAVTTCIGLTGILLDPPYHGMDESRDRVYTHDDNEIWNTVKEWAVAHGDDPLLRIALCGHDGDHGMPDTWTCVPWKAHGGYARKSEKIKNRLRERIWFSPYCLADEQQALVL